LAPLLSSNGSDVSKFAADLRHAVEDGTVKCIVVASAADLPLLQRDPLLSR